MPANAEGCGAPDTNTGASALSSVASGAVLLSQEARATVEHRFSQSPSKRAAGVENQAPANVVPQIGAVKPRRFSISAESGMPSDENSKQSLMTCGRGKLVTAPVSHGSEPLPEFIGQASQDSSARTRPLIARSQPGTPAVPPFLLPCLGGRQLGNDASGSFAVAPAQSYSPPSLSHAKESPRDAYLRACSVAAARGGRLSLAVGKELPAGEVHGWRTPRGPTGICAAVSSQLEQSKAWTPSTAAPSECDVSALPSRASSNPGTPAALSFVPTFTVAAPPQLAGHKQRNEGVVRAPPAALSVVAGGLPAPVQFAPPTESTPQPAARRVFGAPKSSIAGSTPVATPGVPFLTPVASLAPLQQSASVVACKVAISQDAESGLAVQQHPVVLPAPATYFSSHSYATSASSKGLLADDGHETPAAGACVDTPLLAIPVVQKAALQTSAPSGVAPRWADVGGCSLEPEANRRAFSGSVMAVAPINMDASVVGCMDCGVLTAEGEAPRSQQCIFDFARTDSNVTLPPTPASLAASSLNVAAALLSESASDCAVSHPSATGSTESVSCLTHQSSSSELLSLEVRSASEYVFSVAFCNDQLLAGHPFSPGGPALSPPSIALCEEALHELPRRNSETICPPAGMLANTIHPPLGLSATVSTPLLPAITAARTRLALPASATSQEEGPPRSASAAGLVYLGDVLPTAPPSARPAAGSSDVLSGQQCPPQRAVAVEDPAVIGEQEPDCELEPDKSFLWNQDEAIMRRTNSKLDVHDAAATNHVPLDVVACEPPSPAGFLNCGPPSWEGSSRGLLYKAF